MSSLLRRGGGHARTAIRQPLAHHDGDELDDDASVKDLLGVVRHLSDLHSGGLDLQSGQFASHVSPVQRMTPHVLTGLLLRQLVWDSILSRNQLPKTSSLPARNRAHLHLAPAGDGGAAGSGNRGLGAAGAGHRAFQSGRASAAIQTPESSELQPRR